jgi:hypothetical protein
VPTLTGRPAGDIDAFMRDHARAFSPDPAAQVAASGRTGA